MEYELQLDFRTQFVTRRETALMLLRMRQVKQKLMHQGKHLLSKPVGKKYGR